LNKKTAERNQGQNNLVYYILTFSVLDVIIGNDNEILL